MHRWRPVMRAHADTRLVVAAARPVPGTTAGAKAWRDSGLAEHCQGVTVLRDGAYINTGLIVPHRKRPGRALAKGEEEGQRRPPKGPRSRRARDRPDEELQDPPRLQATRRRPHHAVQAVARMHNLALTA